MIEIHPTTTRTFGGNILLETLLERDRFQVRRLVLRDRETFEMNFDAAVPVAVYCVQGTCSITDFTTALDLAPGQTLRGEARSLYVQRPSELVVLIIVSES